MQAYAEGFDILRNKDSSDLAEDERFTLNMADIAEVWPAAASSHRGCSISGPQR